MSNLFLAWKRLHRGKQLRVDLIVFERNLESELSALSRDLAFGYYSHGHYQPFFVRDPKLRAIHKPTVRDRVVHQAFMDALAPFFETRFFFDSFAARQGKGTSRAIQRCGQFIRRVGRNGRGYVWILHGDIARFFASVNHEILFSILNRFPIDVRYQSLCRMVIESFEMERGRGIPLGNLTSQLFGNIYLHEFDRFVKHELAVTAYVRYNDDFFVVSENRSALVRMIPQLREFLSTELGLELPDRKATVRSLSSGIDVLGTVMFSWGMVPRVRMRSAVERQIRQSVREPHSLPEWRRSVFYLGLLGSMKSFWLRERLRISSDCFPEHSWYNSYSSTNS